MFLQKAGGAVDLSSVDAPDGFYGFMSPAFSYAPFASSCPDSEKFHDPVVIGTLLQNAISNNSSLAYRSFLRSMVSHMCADFVGFNPLGGYLAKSKRRQVCFPFCADPNEKM